MLEHLPNESTNELVVGLKQSDFVYEFVSLLATKLDTKTGVPVPPTGTPIDYLNLTIGDCGGIASLLYNCGRKFTTINNTEHVGKLGECFRQATNLYLSNKNEYSYCEGYAISEKLPIPLMHAWCVDKKGNVVDPTWHENTATIPTGYFGIVLNGDFVLETLGITRHYGILDHLFFPEVRKKQIKKILI